MVPMHPGYTDADILYIHAAEKANKNIKITDMNCLINSIEKSALFLRKNLYTRSKVSLEVMYRPWTLKNFKKPTRVLVL
jgi:hypothetical protein